jgi:hypothetical protein
VTASENFAGCAVDRITWTVDEALGKHRNLWSDQTSERIRRARYFCVAIIFAAAKPTAVCGSAVYDGVDSKCNFIVSRVYGKIVSEVMKQVKET